ncbi:MAG: DUF6658 family protein [Cyanophyceae cyanobacterium]
MINRLKQVPLRQILTVFLAGIILCIGTACNSGDVRGARPEVPPVQMGGQNNPHKMGGDTLNQYQTSPNPSAKGQASVPGKMLVAATPNVEQENPGLLYRGDTETSEKSLPIITDKDNTRRFLPEEGQPVIDRSNPNEGIVEKTQKAFKEGSEFIEGAAKQVSPNSR